MTLRTKPFRIMPFSQMIPVLSRPALGIALRRALALALIAVIGPIAPALAQVASISAVQGATPMALHITILDGEDAVNSIRERTAREPIVQVEDENHKPVAGALLLFTIQGGQNGAGASFNGLSSISVTTDAAGRATAHGLVPNSTQGKYTIAVTATVGTLVATAIITQSNVKGGGGVSNAKRISRLTKVSKNPWLFGAIGVVVITVAVRTTVIGGRNPTSISAGTGTVGAP